MNFRRFVVMVCFFIMTAITYGEEMSGHKVVTSDSLQWTDLKSLPTAKTAVIVGDPSKAELFTIRLKAPAGLKVLPHWHPSDEHVTILSGAMHMAMGDKFDSNTGSTVPAGAYSFMPAKVHHYAWFEEETIIQITGMGPWKIIYVNPEDDPSKPKP